MKDEIFQQITELDQALAGFGTLAKLVGMLYIEYVANGVPKPLAAQLVRDWQHDTLTKPRSPDEPKP